MLVKSVVEFTIDFKKYIIQDLELVLYIIILKGLIVVTDFSFIAMQAPRDNT